MFAALGRLVAAALLIMISSSAVAAPKQHGAARLAAVRAVLSASDRADGPGAQVVVTLNGSTAASVAVGAADLERRDAVTSTTAFHAASLPSR